MNKRQLIEAIQQYNLTAHEQFLSQFDEATLQQYLDRLESAMNKRLRYGTIGPVKHTPFRMVS